MKRPRAAQTIGMGAFINSISRCGLDASMWLPHGFITLSSSLPRISPAKDYRHPN